MDVIFDPTRQTAPGGAAATDIIKDGDQRNFMQDVVEASRQVPVLVDFWATWCGPCKTLTPTLEKVVRAAQGRVRLVKIDIDKNRELVQQLAQMGLPLQSVPTVVGFVKGQIADLFQGALPEGEVKKFIETLLKAGGGSLPGADLLADITSHAIRTALQRPELSGLYHLSAAGETSWHGYACLILDLARRCGVKLKATGENVTPIQTSAFPSPARRPLNSRLDTCKLRSTFDLNLPLWQTGVTRMLTEILEERS